MLKEAWSWVKAHAAWVGGGMIALIVGYYLLRRPGSSSSAPSTVSFPAQPGGGSGGGGGSSPSAPPPITLPFSPDFSILGAITDGALKALYESEYNLEVQINAATLAGNSSLVASLTDALTAVKAQIAGYKPSAPAPGPGPGSSTIGSITGQAIHDALRILGSSQPGIWSAPTSDLFAAWSHQISSAVTGGASVPTSVWANIWNTIQQNPGAYWLDANTPNYDAVAKLINDTLTRYGIAPGEFPASWTLLPPSKPAVVPPKVASNGDSGGALPKVPAGVLNGIGYVPGRRVLPGPG